MAEGGAISGCFEDKEFKIIPVTNDQYRETFKKCFIKYNNHPTLIEVIRRQRSSMIVLKEFIRGDMLKHFQGVSKLEGIGELVDGWTWYLRYADRS